MSIYLLSNSKIQLFFFTLIISSIQINQDFAYSQSLTTFSPQGALLQLNYATKAANIGKSLIAIHQNDYTILVGLKRTTETFDNLYNYENSAENVIFQITPQVYIGYSGLAADARILINEARKQAVMYNSTYGEEISVNMLAKEISNIYQEKTQEGGYRPFGTNVTIVDYNTIQSIDPSGSIFTFQAWSTGNKFQEIRKELEKRLINDNVQQNISYDNAIVMALQILKEQNEIELKASDFQILIATEKDTHLYNKYEVENFFNLTE